MLLFKDNLSRGNMGAVKALEKLFPEPGRLQFIYADLGDAAAVSFFKSSINFCVVIIIIIISLIDIISG